MGMTVKQKRDCPICGCKTGHINNHVRMSNGDGHGPTQQYPDGWDQSTESFDDPDGSETGSDLVLEHGDDDRDDDRDDEPERLSLDDDESDFRDYECPNDDCSETVDYLDDECAEGHSQTWVVA